MPKKFFILFFAFFLIIGIAVTLWRQKFFDQGKMNANEQPIPKILTNPVTIWQPRPGTSWQWQLEGQIDTSFNVDMYDVDLFDTPQSTILTLHNEGRVVICYFSAGSWEDWRPDADSFPQAGIGTPLEGWPGEKWLDIRDLASLRPILLARLDLAVAKKCDGVEPDNVDGYLNNSGFPLTFADQIDFNTFIAQEAHARELSVGLKNDLDQIHELVPLFDWALNEQCFQFQECDALLPFIQAGKTVFGVEYEGEPQKFCAQANDLSFDWLVKNISLDSWQLSCRTNATK